MKDEINDRGTKIPKRNNPWDDTSNIRQEEAIGYDQDVVDNGVYYEDDNENDKKIEE